jgi:hypothetical protein
VGSNQISLIVDSYATGSAFGQSAGGLVGANEGSDPGGILRSYAIGTVSATQFAGGLIGEDDYIHQRTSKRAYWDMTTSGIINKGQGAGNMENDPGIKGLSNTKLQSSLPKGFNPRVWTENPGINGGLPFLIANPPPK